MGTDFIIRRARAEDDAAIGDLLIRSFTETYARKMPEVVVHDRRKTDLRDVATKRRDAVVLVAAVGERIVGTVTLYGPGAAGSKAFLPKTCDLRYFALAPEAQGKGLSKHLLDAIERVAREELVAESISLHVRRGAHGVARLYAGRGYRRRPEGDVDNLPEIFLEAYVLDLKGSAGGTGERSSA